MTAQRRHRLALLRASFGQSAAVLCGTVASTINNPFVKMVINCLIETCWVRSEGVHRANSTTRLHRACACVARSCNRDNANAVQTHQLIGMRTTNATHGDCAHRVMDNKRAHSITHMQIEIGLHRLRMTQSSSRACTFLLNMSLYTRTGVLHIYSAAVLIVPKDMRVQSLNFMAK